MISPFSKAEVRHALTSLNQEESPGPDGLLIFFLMIFWEVVEDVMAIFQAMLEGSCQLYRINRFLIFLIPKKEGAKTLDNFKPISISNYIYLLVAKVLASRLSGVLDGTISPC